MQTADRKFADSDTHCLGMFVSTFIFFKTLHGGKAYSVYIFFLNVRHRR